ncbi:integral membrane protein-like protein [Lindgomyces ingoldianus]|uniref:Integral membrane protein-like protein n=1 Tax=Lindgomyces ingoldianus TaxID=673940 RepID=A0ACB6QD79_9PLEO|nr:integral membrane protein-like protein [Lindgomyces ingoldianus]KAF2464881.1 integral membrane protein-like protein [Lindgomyces ingoldianus]
MSAELVSQTAQGAVLSVTSNVLAQVISSYKQRTPFSLNLAPVIKFAVFSIISNPPNILWQIFLEDIFPTNVQAPAPKSEKHNGKPTPARQIKTQMSATNVFIKFVLDQTFGAVVNTLMFLIYMGYMNASPAGKQGPWDSIAKEIQEKFYPMIMDGYKVWPLFSLVSFLWIPVDKRVVVGCLVGVGWGIYLSLLVES